jgi:hypothetical protein
MALHGVRERAERMRALEPDAELSVAAHQPRKVPHRRDRGDGGRAAKPDARVDTASLRRAGEALSDNYGSATRAIAARALAHGDWASRPCFHAAVIRDASEVVLDHLPKRRHLLAVAVDEAIIAREVARDELGAKDHRHWTRRKHVADPSRGDRRVNGFE